MTEVRPFESEARELALIAQSTGETAEPQLEAYQVAFGAIHGLYSIADRPGDPVSARTEHAATVVCLQNRHGGNMNKEPFRSYVAQMEDQYPLRGYLVYLHVSLAEIIAERREEVDTPGRLADYLGEEAEIVSQILVVNGATTTGETRRQFEQKVQKVIHAGRLWSFALNLRNHVSNEQTQVPLRPASVGYLSEAAYRHSQRFGEWREAQALVNAAYELTPT